MITVQLPSGRKVNIQTNDPQVAAAAARKFVASDPYESHRAYGAKHPIASTIQGGVQTLEDSIPFLSDAHALFNSKVDMLTAPSSNKKLNATNIAGDMRVARDKAFQRQQAIQQAYADSFKQDHPVISSLTKGVGLAAPVGAALLTGGASALPEVAAEAPAASSLLKGLVQRGTAGAMAGYAYGAGQPRLNPQDRLNSANTGAAIGGTVGAIVPPAAGWLAKKAGDVGQSVANTVVRATNKAAGGSLLDATKVASQRLVAALKADGATPNIIKAALNSFMKNGATDPTLLDIASRLPSGGANTMSLVRAASMRGTAKGIATDYADQIAADLQGKAIAHTRQLTPSTMSAPVAKDAAIAARDKAATEQYRAPYQTPMDARPVVPAMEGDAGRVGINSAYKDADALRLQAQMDELQKLRNAAKPVETPQASIGGAQFNAPGLEEKIRKALGIDQNQPVPVTLGTLDRVKIALNDAGQTALKSGDNSRAAGFFQRAQEIDDHLAKTNPEYAAARNNYASASAGIDALGHGGTGLTAHPEDFAAGLADLIKRGGDQSNVVPMGQIGYRQALTDAIGAPTEAATGTLNRTATSTNQRLNLETMFGPDKAQTYRAGLTDLTDQLANARHINPNTGSATAGRLADLGLVEPGSMSPPRLSLPHLILGALDKVRRGATLTDAEREAITRIATTHPEIDKMDFTDALKALPSQQWNYAQGQVAGTVGGQRDNNQ